MAAISLVDPQVPGRTAERRRDVTAIPPRHSLRYTERWPRERLESFRLKGDPLADSVAESLHQRDGGLTQIHDLLSTVRRLAEEEVGCEGDVFRGFLADVAKVPEWADRAKIERGQRLQAVHLPFMGLSLLNGSLIGGAVYSNAAVVTALAGNLTANPTRRVNETGLLLAALAFPGSLLEAGGEAHDSLTRVRLLHAALRHWLPRSGRLQRHRSMVPAHVYVEGEVPLCQQDLAITLGVFCYTNIRSLHRMGTYWSPADVDSYVMMWRYAGYVLGIDEELLPNSFEDQEEFMSCCMLHQGSPETINGEKSKQFIDAFTSAGAKRLGPLVPFSVVQTFMHQVVRYLNGMDYTEGMGIENLGDNHWTLVLLRTVGFLFGTVLPRVPLGEEMLFRLHTRALRAQLKRRGTPTGHAAGSGVRSKL